MANNRKYFEQRLDNAARLVVEKHAAFLEDPNDPETNHKLRVSIRTLRSLIDFMSPWQKRKQNKRIQQNLKFVVRRTSRLRELDVLCEIAQEGGASDELLSFCEERAARERDAVVEALSSKDYAKAIRKATRATSKLRWKKGVAKKGPRGKAVRKRYDELATSLLSDLDALDENDYERVHDVRKRAKQIRYVSERFPEILGPDAVQAAKDMKAEQDRLGAICDARVNNEIVQTFIEEEGLSPTLAEELRQIV